MDSELTVVPESPDCWCVVCEGLVDVAAVGGVPGPVLFLGALVSVGQDLLPGDDVLLHHLAEENVVDLDVMRRESVVQETGREHHVVPVEPELSSVLRVEHVLVTGLRESAPSEDHAGGPEEHEQPRVVEGTVAKTDESGADGAHHGVDTENGHPEVVDDSEGSVEGVLAVLSLAHLQALEDTPDKAWSLRQSLVHEVLKTAGVSQYEGLNSLRHIK